MLVIRGAADSWPPGARIAALLPRADIEQLRKQLAGRVEVIAFASPQQLLTGLQREPTDLVVTDWRDGLGRDVTTALREAALRGVSAPVMVRISLDRTAVSAVLALSDVVGYLSVSIHGFDDLFAMVHRQLGLGARPEAARAVLLRSYYEANPKPEPVLVGSIVLGFPRTPPVRLASLLQVSERTLLRITHELCLPAPRALIRWSCCLQCVWLMEVAHWPAKMIARAAGFLSISAFNHYIARCTGCPPRQAADRIGYGGLLKRWLSLLALQGGGDAGPVV